MNKIYFYQSFCREVKRLWQGLALLTVLLIPLRSFAQNYVFSGGQATNFGTIDLTKSTASPYWGTDRSASPGYFSAVGTATYINAADAKYNIFGYNKWYATAAGQSYTAPVGDETQLRNLTISGTTANNDIFATAWFTGSPSTVADPTAPNAGTHTVSSVGTGIVSVSTLGFWDWQDVSGTGAGKTITVDIPDLTGFSPATNLRLVGWNGTQWVSLSASATASGNTNHSTLSGTMIAGITAIGIGTNAAAAAPDITASQFFSDLQLSVGETVDYVVGISNVGVGATSAPIVFTVTNYAASSGLTLSLNAAASVTIDGDLFTLNNSDFDVTVTSFRYTFTSKAGVTLPASGVKFVGFTLTRSGGTAGNTNNTVTITNGTGGGETPTNNNTIANPITKI